MTARQQRLKGPKKTKKRWSLPPDQEQELKDQERELKAGPRMGHNQPPPDQRLETKKRGDYGREPKRGRGRYGFSVPEAGAMIGLGRNASYKAARAGEIPTIPFGGIYIVPAAVWLRKLGVKSEAAE
jgi:hypothetical protein